MGEGGEGGDFLLHPVRQHRPLQRHHHSRLYYHCCPHLLATTISSTSYHVLHLPDDNRAMEKRTWLSLNVGAWKERRTTRSDSCHDCHKTAHELSSTTADAATKRIVGVGETILVLYLCYCFLLEQRLERDWVRTSHLGEQ